MRDFLIGSMQYFLLACALAAVIRILLGPGAADRLVALNLLSGIVLAFLALSGIGHGRAVYLDVALVYDIFGFLGLLAVARLLKDKALGPGGGE